MVAALCAGFAKTAVGGLGLVTVALVALVMPAHEATAAVLLLLLIGDTCALAQYRHDADWQMLRRVVPAVLPGLALGAVLLAVLSDDVLRRGVGLVLLLLVVMQFVQGHPSVRPRHSVALLAGAAAGTATMVANAGGPVMTLYLFAQGVDKRRFLGTNAWFFAGVNLCKVPFAAGLGLIDAGMLNTTLVLAPAVLAGAWCGVVVARRLRQRAFETVVLIAGAASAVALIAT